MFYIAIFLLSIFFFLLYKRYCPVSGVKRMEWSQLNKERRKIIDLRDYNVSYDSPIKGAMNVPIAYLNRNIREIPKEELHVIASDHVEKNIGIRFLRQKGYHVVGYTIVKGNQLESC